jgi:hypothetical protein
VAEWRLVTFVGRGMLLAMVAFAPFPAATQGVDDAWVRSFYNLERSHIDHPLGEGLIFEAQIAPQLIVAQTVHDRFAGGAVAGDREGHWAYSASVSPMVRLRMVNTASQPVRTPSYMPHGVVQLFRLKNLNTADRESELRRGPFEMWMASAMLSHHSNGQDGCLYTTQVKQPDARGGVECVFLAGRRPDPQDINRLDGSFSKNFLRAGLIYRRLYLPDGLDDVIHGSWYVGGSAETHRSPIVNWIPGKIPDDQAALYRTWQWRLIAGGTRRSDGQKWSGGHYLDLAYESYPDAADVLTKWSISAEYARTFDRYGGWGLYARAFAGQDYYNLGFGRKLKRLSFGVVWAQDRFERVGAGALGPLE